MSVYVSPVSAIQSSDNEQTDYFSHLSAEQESVLLVLLSYSNFHPAHRSATDTMLDPSQMPAQTLARPGIPPPPIPSGKQLEWLRSLPPPPSHPPPPPPSTACHTAGKPNFTPEERERLRRAVYENDPESVAVCDGELVPNTPDDHSQPPSVDWAEVSSRSSAETKRAVVFGDEDETFRDCASSTHRSDAKPASSMSISPSETSGKEMATST